MVEDSKDEVAKASAGGSQRFQVLSTYSPMPCLHPTDARIRDIQTGKVYQWNSRAHRKMRYAWHHDKTTPQPSSHLRLWCCEPHLVSWWNVISNMTSNVFWILNGTYNLFPWISSNSAQVTYAGAALGGFFLITTNYLTYIEAINNTSCDVRVPDDKKKHKKRIFVRPRKVYGRFKSPIGYDKHVMDQDKFRQKLIEMGFPYVESVESKKLLTIEDYDKAVTASIPTKAEESGDVTTSSTSGAGHPENGKIATEIEINATEEGANSSLIGAKVNIVDSNYVSTTQVLEITRNKAPPHRSYQWWSWHPPVEHIGVLTSVIGLCCALLYMIPMCVSYPWSKRDDISEGKELFFYDLLQGITHTGFAIIAHMSVAEAAGSWWKPKLNAIGYYVAVCNVIGSWGFALCGYFLIPGTVGASCCQNLGQASSIACFTGACAYTVGGIIQMIEFANPVPIVFCKKRFVD